MCNYPAHLTDSIRPEPERKEATTVTANERRAEIIRLLVARRSINTGALAAELGVCRRTICTDIEILTLEYPLESSRGNGGCVKVADWYHPHRNIFSQEQQSTLYQLMETATLQQREVLRQMLLEYGSAKAHQAELQRSPA